MVIKAYLHLNEIATLAGVKTKDGRRLLPEDLNLIQDGAVVFSEKEILWVGKTSELPKEYSSTQTHDLQGHVLTPELVDSHTHIVFGGDRAQEYADRLNGKSYEAIAKEGGGILLSMKKTNELSKADLFNLGKERIERLVSYGIGTIEIKSGYGLNLQKELELSEVIHDLKLHFAPKVQIFNTYLAAHDVPRTFKSSAEYLDAVVLPLLRNLASKKILDGVDIFHEKNYFSDEDVTRLFTLCDELGISKRMHADELNDNAGASLGVGHHALSVDHLLKISDRGIENLAQNKTVATLLPGTAFFLGKPLAPARKMLDAGVKLAIASDYNPGSCHCDNVLLVASMSAAQLKLNQAELWAGLTFNASHALGFWDQGAIVKGLRPRFSLFKTDSLSHLTYKWGRNFSVREPET